MATRILYVASSHPGATGLDPITDASGMPVALTAGTAIIGKVGIDQTTPGTTNGVSLVPGTTGPIASDALTLAQSANSTTTGTTFAALTPTETVPAASSSRAVITWVGRESLFLIPFGRNANNLTFKFRVTGWTTKGTAYYPTTLCECTATLSSSLTGVSGQTPSNSDLFADTLTVDKGVGVVLASPADDTGIASVEVPIGQFDFVEIQFIRNSSATETNALYSTY